MYKNLIPMNSYTYHSNMLLFLFSAALWHNKTICQFNCALDKVELFTDVLSCRLHNNNLQHKKSIWRCIFLLNAFKYAAVQILQHQINMYSYKNPSESHFRQKCILILNVKHWVRVQHPTIDNDSCVPWHEDMSYIRLWVHKQYLRVEISNCCFQGDFF